MQATKERNPPTITGFLAALNITWSRTQILHKVPARARVVVLVIAMPTPIAVFADVAFDVRAVVRACACHGEA